MCSISNRAYDDEAKSVVGSLAKQETIDEMYEEVAVLKDDKISAEDYANYLIQPKNQLAKIKEFVGLKGATEDNVGSTRDGSAFSYLAVKMDYIKFVIDMQMAKVTQQLQNQEHFAGNDEIICNRRSV